MDSLKILLLASVAWAAGMHEVRAGGKPDCGSCCVTCGKRVCCPSWESVKTKESCFEVECKEICIKAVQFPWSKRNNRGCTNGCLGDCRTCAPRCGRVRVVNVLTTKSYECDRCVCKWEIKDVCEPPAGNDDCTGCVSRKLFPLPPHVTPPAPAGRLFQPPPAPYVFRQGVPSKSERAAGRQSSAGKVRISLPARRGAGPVLNRP